MKFDRFPGIALLLALPFLFSSAYAANETPSRVEEIDHIVAVVDEDIVVRSELDREMATIVGQLRQQGQRLPARDVLERQVLERLILKKLQLAAAQRAGINISEDLLAQAINNIAQRNRLSMSQFRSALQAEGMNFRTFKEQIREQMTIQQLRDQEIVRRIRVTEQEINAFMARESGANSERAQYLLYHILVATPEGASAQVLAQARAKAEAMVARLRSGEDFQSMALRESDGRQALEGGNLGWRAANQLPTLFIDQVTQMNRGDISNPIRTTSGYHIIKLQDFKGGERKIITQTKARHILIIPNEVTSNEVARTRLEQLRARVMGGDDFSALARSHSEDKSSAIKGGELGWLNPGDTLPRFEEEMAKLRANEISEPFQTEFGWHLLQVLERRQHDSTKEVQKAEARKAIIKRKTSEQAELYLRRLRDEAYVEVMLDQY